MKPAQVALIAAAQVARDTYFHGPMALLDKHTNKPLLTPAMRDLSDAIRAEQERYSDLRERVLRTMTARGWSTEWIHRSAYLHLESAELAEAVRGKRGDPLDEAGDVLITLLALARHSLPEIIEAAERKLSSLEACIDRYQGEHVDAPKP